MAKTRLKIKTNQAEKYTGVSNLSKNSPHVSLWAPLAKQFHDPKEARKRPSTKITKYENGVPVETVITKGTPKRKIKTPAEMAQEKMRVLEALKNKRRVIFIHKKIDASINKK